MEQIKMDFYDHLVAHKPRIWNEKELIEKIKTEKGLNRFPQGWIFYQNGRRIDWLTDEMMGMPVEEAKNKGYNVLKWMLKN